MSELKKLVGDTVIYGLSSIVGRYLNYLLVPLYTSIFLPAQYGIVTELYAYVAFLNVLYLYGMETAFFRFANKHKEKELYYYSAAFISILGTSILFSGLLAFFATPIVVLLEYPGQEHYVRWFAAIMAIDAIVAIPFARLRLLGKAIKFAAVKLTSIGLNILLNLTFLIWIPELSSILPEGDVGYVFLSNLLANAVLIPLLFAEIGRVRWVWQYSYQRELLKYGLPLLIIGFAGVTNEMLSRAMLKHLLPEGFYPSQSRLDALGIFGACYKLAIFMTLGIQAFRYAAEPFFFKKTDDRNSPLLFSQVADAFVVFGSLVFVAICFNLDLLAVLFLRNSEYHQGLSVVPWLLMGGLLLGIYYNLSVWYKLTDKTGSGAIISVAGAAMTIVLNFVLIPVLGYDGSAIATFFTYFSMTVISFLWGKSHFPVPYKWKKALIYLFLAGATVWAHYALKPEDLVFQTAINFLLLLALGLVLYQLERKNFKFN